MRKLKVLIAGADSTTYTLLKYLRGNSNVEKLYALPDNDMLKGLAELVDIKENDIENITLFAKEKEIDLTIVTSPILIVNGIANSFETRGLTIFAPTREAGVVTYFNGAAKKTMYKLKIPTTRFAIFDKLPNALQYLRQMHFPVSVAPDFKILTAEKKEYKYYTQAKQAIDDLFYDGEERVVVEENNNILKEYNLYFLTDGYSAYHLGTTEYDENCIAVSPSPTITKEITNNVKTAVITLLEDLNNYSTSYNGVLGVKIKSNGRFYKVIDFMSTFEKYDYETIIPSIKNDLIELYYSAAIGSLSDDFQKISFNETYSCSYLINRIISETEFNNIHYTPINEDTGIITTTAGTVTAAKKRLIDILSENTSGVKI